MVNCNSFSLGRYETFVNVSGNLFVVALEITNVAMEDAGKYRVTCKNEFGESNANIGLNFDGEVIVKRHFVSLVVSAVS